MSAQYKVCYSPQFYEKLTQNDQVCIDEVYKRSIVSLINENNIIKEDIIIPSISQLDYLESQLDAAINVSNLRMKNEAKMTRLRSFIEKHSQ
jgi:hypothetical protein